MPIDVIDTSIMMRASQFETRRFSAARDKMAVAMLRLSERSVDTGAGLGCCDFWVTIDGLEYLVTMRRSGR